MKNKDKVIKEAWVAEIGEEKYNEVKEHIDVVKHNNGN